MEMLKESIISHSARRIPHSALERARRWTGDADARRYQQTGMDEERIIPSLRIPHSGLRTGEGPQMNAD
jgi:hypothetical protein